MEIHRFQSQIIGGEPKLFVPPHIKAEREAELLRQRTLLQQRRDAIDSGTRRLVEVGYRVEEVHLEEYPDKSGDPYLSTFAVKPNETLSPLKLWLRLWWREHISTYYFRVVEDK